MDELLSKLLEQSPEATPAELHERILAEFPEATKAQVKNKVKRLRVKDTISAKQITDPDSIHPSAESMDELVAAGKLYSALVKLELAGDLDHALMRAPAVVRERVLEGICSEVVGGALLLSEIPGKGLGYVASRDLAAGSVLLFDTAFVGTDHECGSVRNAQRAQEKAEQFPEFFQTKIQTLHAGDFQAGAFGFDLLTLKAIMDANQFGATRVEGWSVLFPAAARFNHSCMPSAVLDGLPEFAVVRAVRSIKKGEEVTVSYLPADNTFDIRQEKLRERGFDCDCIRCARDKAMDPQEMIPCACQKKWFRADRSSEKCEGDKCEGCGFMFDFRDARERLERLESDIHFMQTHEAQATDPRLLAERLTKTLDFARREPGSVPLTNTFLCGVVGHLSSCYFFSAKRCGGGTSAWIAYYLFRVIALETMESLCPGEVPPLFEYARSLFRFVNTVKWPTKAEQKKWESKYAHACHVFFGQKVAPPSLVSKVMLG